MEVQRRLRRTNPTPFSTVRKILNRLPVVRWHESSFQKYALETGAREMWRGATRATTSWGLIRTFKRLSSFLKEQITGIQTNLCDSLFKCDNYQTYRSVRYLIGDFTCCRTKCCNRGYSISIPTVRTSLKIRKMERCIWAGQSAIRFGDPSPAGGHAVPSPDRSRMIN
jgi:hypothetical protein